MSNIVTEARSGPIAVQACWTADHVGRAIQSTANLSDADNHYFLASHTPIRRIIDDRTKEEISDATYFDLIFRSAHRNLQAIVYGEPGTGKSHLIHWLKLRCDEEARSSQELNNLKCVLIERRNGSLKDALEQIVEQLGDDFSSYFDKIHTALRQISSDTARRELAGQFRLELGTKRVDRDLPPLPPDLRYLSECFVAPGFGDWLCRTGGTIHRLISRLTEASSVDERETTPEFDTADFLPHGDYHRQNPPIVRELIDQFYDDEDLRRQACEYANAVVREAVLGMTGLTATDLQNVFFDIRRELARQRRRLVLLVEDVSVYAALDRDLVVVFEPQVRQGLCDLRVVFGMTGQGLDAIRALPDNQVQRITYIHSISQTSTRWGTDYEELARFLARYLNTIRLPEDRVRALAAARRDGREVSVSACEQCPFGIKDECHARFGSVTFEDGVQVGLFPFSPSAPGRWFSLFAERGSSTFSQTPRTLLNELLFKGLERPENIPERFPPASIVIPPAALPYWTSFEQQYCGNWSSDDKKRLQRLAAVWVIADSAHGAALQLEGLRQAFGFGPFTRVLEPSPPPLSTASKSSLRTPQKNGSSSLATPISPQFSRLLTVIEEWRSGKPLNEDTIPRDLLFDLIKKSIQWEDIRAVPPKERQRLLKSKALIEIEDQRSKASGAVVRFDRSDETADLLRALAHFEYIGSRTWAFEDGERFKRMVAAWLRRHTDRVAGCLVPNVPDKDRPIRTACGYLALLYTTNSRKKLPIDRFPELVGAMFLPRPVSSPQRFSEFGQRLVDSIAEKHQMIRDWLANELSIQQGETGGCVYIDPLPILRALRTAGDTIEAPRLDDEYKTDFAGGRYLTVASLPDIDRFWTEERSALADLRAAIVALLSDADDPSGALTDYCEELSSIKKLQEQKEVDFIFPHEEFDPLWRERLYSLRLEVWSTELRRSEEVLVSTSNTSLAIYTPDTLKQLKKALVAAEDYLNSLERQIRRRLDAVTEEGDPDQLRDRLTGALHEITNLSMLGNSE
jgi:Cdc6-like AAA superfamily ATPase